MNKSFLKFNILLFILFNLVFFPGTSMADKAELGPLLPYREVLVPLVPPFSSELKLGDKGEEVLHLQQFLNQHGFIVSTKGDGSPGNETDFFGEKTRIALRQYQNAYGAYILAPAGLSQSTGVFGAHSITHANTLMKYRFFNLFPVEKEVSNSVHANAHAHSNNMTANSLSSVDNSVLTDISKTLSAITDSLLKLMRF